MAKQLPRAEALPASDLPEARLVTETPGQSGPMNFALDIDMAKRRATHEQWMREAAASGTLPQGLDARLRKSEEYAAYCKRVGVTDEQINEMKTDIEASPMPETGLDTYTAILKKVVTETGTEHVKLLKKIAVSCLTYEARYWALFYDQANKRFVKMQATKPQNGQAHANGDMDFDLDPAPGVAKPGPTADVEAAAIDAIQTRDPSEIKFDLDLGDDEQPSSTSHVAINVGEKPTK